MHFYDMIRSSPCREPGRRGAIWLPQPAVGKLNIPNSYINVVSPVNLTFVVAIIEQCNDNIRAECSSSGGKKKKKKTSKIRESGIKIKDNFLK